jgi:hypothetical protein
MVVHGSGPFASHTTFLTPRCRKCLHQVYATFRGCTARHEPHAIPYLTLIESLRPTVRHTWCRCRSVRCVTRKTRCC